MRTNETCLIILCCGMLLSSGCMRLALRSSPDLLNGFNAVMQEECDPGLAEEAIPANLKLLEGLQKNDPDNPLLLQTLCMGFCGYSLLFVEEKDTRRASDLYLRARNYGLKALGPKNQVFMNLETKESELIAMIRSLDRKNLHTLIWTLLAWASWINLNLDRPEALAYAGMLEICFKDIVEQEGGYFYGLPHLVLGITYAVRPPMLGGNIRQSRDHFEKALALSQGRFLMAHYYYARHYAVRVQDQDLFLRIIEQSAAVNPADLKEVCLLNTVFQSKTLALKKEIDELFY